MVQHDPLDGLTPPCRVATREQLREGKAPLWDSRQWHESTADLRARMLQARIACQRCPLLDACEQRLTDHEVRRLRIDGVVAGRCSDVQGHAGSEGPVVQTTCRACRSRMRPQWKRDKPNPRGARQHMGEGLCEQCHPVMSRAARAMRRSACAS